MTRSLFCGTAMAALMMSSLPALALYVPDNPQECPEGMMCITGGTETDSGTDAESDTDTGPAATVTRPASGRGGVAVENNGRAADPTARGRERSGGRAATVNSSGDD